MVRRGGFVSGIRRGGDLNTPHRRSAQRRRAASDPLGRFTTGSAYCYLPSTKASPTDSKSSFQHFHAR